MSLRVDRFLNAIYVWCLGRIEPDEVEKWVWQLNEPIEGHLTAATVEAEQDSFLAFAGAFGVKPPSTG